MNNSNDLMSLLNRQETLLNILKKEYPFSDDPIQINNEIHQILVQNGINLVNRSMTQGSSARENAAGDSPRSHKKSRKINIQTNIISQNEIEKISKSPKIKKARDNYYIKQLNINISKIMILIDQLKKQKKMISKAQDQKKQQEENQDYKSEFDSQNVQIKNRQHFEKTRQSLPNIHNQNILDIQQVKKFLENNPKLDQDLGQQIKSKISMNALPQTLKKVNNYSQQHLSSQKSEQTEKQKRLNFKSILGLMNKNEQEQHVNEQNYNINGSQILSHIENGFKQWRGSNTSQLQKLKNDSFNYNYQSMKLNKRSSSQFNMQDLIVNSQPDLPPKVSIEYASIPQSERIEELKKRNLSRFESVANNLQMIAEKNKFEYLDRLRRSKKVMKMVEQNNKNEYAQTQIDINQRYEKQQRILEMKKHEEKLQIKQSIKDYRRHIKEIKQGFPEPKVNQKQEQINLKEEKKPVQNEENQIDQLNLDINIKTHNQSKLQDSSSKREIQNIAQNITRNLSTSPSPPKSQKKALHQEVGQVDEMLNRYKSKLIKGQDNYIRNMSEISKQIHKHSEKVMEKNYYHKKMIADENAQIENYVLPSFIGEDDFEQKEKMGKNLKDFVIMKQLNQSIKNANQIAQYRKEEILQKNQKLMEKFQQKKHQLDRGDKQYKSQLNQKQKQTEEKVKNLFIQKIEQINIKKENSLLRKLDQEQKLENLKHQSKNKMIELQAKHFGVDAKNKIQNLILEQTKQKNLLFENSKKNELNTIGSELGLYQIKPLKQYQEIGDIMEKIQEVEISRIPKGLRVLSNLRHTKISNNI